jgi:hypothetical protein
VCRKFTTTNTIIPNNSCHPVQHALAAIKFLTNRRDSYHLHSTNKQIESGIIDQILHSNGYDASHTHKPPTPQTCSKSLQPGTKWARFTYVGRETRYIIKLLCHTPIRVTYTTRKIIQKLPSTPPPPTADKNSKSRIYKLTRPNCQRNYIGQTGRHFPPGFASTTEPVRMATPNPNLLNTS